MGSWFLSCQWIRNDQENIWNLTCRHGKRYKHSGWPSWPGATYLNPVTWKSFARGNSLLLCDITKIQSLIQSPSKSKTYLQLIRSLLQWKQSFIWPSSKDAQLIEKQAQGSRSVLQAIWKLRCQQGAEFLRFARICQVSWVEKVKQLPMSYDCLTRMLTHPLRRYMFGLRGGLFWHGLTRSLRGNIL